MSILQNYFLYNELYFQLSCILWQSSFNVDAITFYRHTLGLTLLPESACNMAIRNGKWQEGRGSPDTLH